MSGHVAEIARETGFPTRNYHASRELSIIGFKITFYMIAAAAIAWRTDRPGF